MIPFSAPLYRAFVSDAPADAKDLLRRHQSGEIQLTTAVDRLYAQLSRPLWLRFTRLVYPAVRLTPALVKKLARGWSPAARTGDAPDGLYIVLPLIVHQLDIHTIGRLVRTCRWMNANISILTRVVALERRGQYERVGNWSVRVHGRDGTVLISLVHRRLPIVRLQVADGRTYFATTMQSYRLRTEDARLVVVDWDNVEQTYFSVNSQLTELMQHMNAGHGWPDIKLWFEFIPSHYDIGVRLFINAPSLMSRAGGIPGGGVLEMDMGFYMEQA